MTMSLFGFTLVRVTELESLRGAAAAAAAAAAAGAAAGAPAGAAAAAPPVPAAPPAEEPVPEAPPPVARELVRLADQLPDLLPGKPGVADDTVNDTVQWLNTRIQELLAACDVIRIEEAGCLDFSRHEVAGTRPAPDADSAHHIAATVRPGYSWRGRMLRPQQVIAYVLAPPDSPGDESQ
jgi:hypothetical protein